MSSEDIDIKRTLQNMTNPCRKIIEIDLSSDSYKSIKTIDGEKSKYYSLTRWVMEYAINDDIYPEDKIDFIKFMNIYNLKKYFNKNDKALRVYYRRKLNDKWIWVCLEITKDYEYSENNPIVLLTIKDVDDDYIGDMLNAKKNQEDYDSITRFQNGKKYKDKLASLQKAFPCSIGMIGLNIEKLNKKGIDEFNDFTRIIKLLFKFEQIYQPNKNNFFIIIEDIDSEEFQLKLLQTYGFFYRSKLRDYIDIVSGWTDEEEAGIDYVTKITEKKMYRIKLENDTY